MENSKKPFDYKKKEPRIIEMVHGKIMPQAIHLEEGVLGALMLDQNSIDECLLILRTSDVFYKEPHRVIFEAISELYADNSVIDLLTVSARLKSMGKLEVAGGDYYLISLTQKISSSAHIESHSRLLQQFYIKRQLIRDASLMLSTAYNDDKDSLELLAECFI